MRLQVLHLSDLHLNDDNPVLEHVDRIVDAGASLYSQADACLVLLTGDIADTGAEDEYLTAIDLLDELRQGLSERLSESTRLAFFTVPGNHDCNFASGQQLRSKMVSDIVDDPTLVEDEEVVNLCTEVQDNYRQFEDLCVADLITRTPLLSELRLEIAGEIVSLIGLNTSWMSRLHEEPGQIVYPPDELSKAQGGDIVITSLHHPYPWLSCVPILVGLC